MPSYFVLIHACIDGLQILTQWEDAFNHPTGSKLGLLGAIQNIGSLASLPFTPYFADGIGRKKTVFFGAFVLIVGAIIQTASQSVNMFIGARFLRKFTVHRKALSNEAFYEVGFGLGFATAAAPMLVMEIAYP